MDMSEKKVQTGGTPMLRMEHLKGRRPEKGRESSECFWRVTLMVAGRKWVIRYLMQLWGAVLRAFRRASCVGSEDVLSET